MYSDSDLDAAVAAGALTPEAAASLRAFVARRLEASPVDEEHFRLLTGFNDIFVSIAAALLLTALAWLGRLVFAEFSPAAVAVASWGFAEFFTRRRRMALPSILLLLAFVGAVFSLGSLLVVLKAPAIAEAKPVAPVAAGAALAALAAYAHWRRFMVPITVAAGTAALVAMALTLLLYFAPGARAWLNPLLMLAGLAVFALAMRWDASDRQRMTRRADVAFWLHLLAAPLVIHPVFAMLGLTGIGGASVSHAAAAVAIYFVLAVVALAIDRRAVLVSALFYVLYAISALFRAAGSVSESFALTALVIGSALLLLSAFWHPVRRQVLGWIPPLIRNRLPAV
ncbi:MAG TPA: hypothetical protein VMU85_10970 [Stellaceae bacterium]|nr:hypothetical protein [Stellaceae bacterium]